MEKYINDCFTAETYQMTDKVINLISIQQPRFDAETSASMRFESDYYFHEHIDKELGGTEHYVDFKKVKTADMTAIQSIIDFNNHNIANGYKPITLSNCNSRIKRQFMLEEAGATLKIIKDYKKNSQE